MPEVKVDQKRTYRVEGVHCDECPVSLISDESKALIEIEAMNHHAQKATGATLFGQDSAQWPAVWHDVVTLIQIQRTLDENAFNRSLNDGRR